MEPEPSAPNERWVCPACNTRFDTGAQFCTKDGAKLLLEVAPADAVSVGEVLIDKYRIERKIGEGGMGEVYAASHVYINRRYALKLLRPEITSSAEAVARFHQEAQSASSIGHNNIVEIEDFGRLPNGNVYLVMEFLEGQSLADRLRKGPPLELDEYLGYAIQVCNGLAAAHRKGIIHRDMKPENIFLGEKAGRTICKILDFGIAKITSDQGQRGLTRTGTIFGTPHYMSPEQALGKDLDHRSDVYSMGVILYEMAAGRVPFQGESFMGVLTQHITSTPVPPHEVAPDRNIPPAFEALVLRAMSKEPDDRFATLDEMIDPLVQIATEAVPTMGSASRIYQALVLETGGVESGPIPTTSSGPLSVSPLRQSSPIRRSRPSFAPASSRADSATAFERPHRALETDPEPILTDKVDPLPSFAKKRHVWVVGLGLLAVGGVVMVAYPVLRDRRAGAPADEASAPAKREKKIVLTPPEPLVPTLAEMLIESVPSGAAVLAGGRVIAETPDVVRLRPGATLAVTLHKDGFSEKSVILDPARGHKMLVELERPRVMAPHAPPIVAPPHEPAPVVRTVKPLGKTHPIRRVVKRRAVGRGGGASTPEVLDPY